MVYQEKYRTITCLLALTVFVGNAQAAENAGDERPDVLSGDYRLMTTQTCVRTPFQFPPAAGFDPVTHQLLTAGESLTAVGAGLVRFAEDGSVRILDGIQTEVSVDRISAGQTPVTPPAEFTCSGNYGVQQEKISIALSCDVKSPQPGVSVTLGPLNFNGFMGYQRQSIALTNIAGDIQTVSVAVSGNVVQQRQRICSEQALLIKQ